MKKSDFIEESGEISRGTYIGIVCMLSKGNVIRNTSMNRKFVVQAEREISGNEEFVCKNPHDDGDFSYLCGSNYCKCTQ